ncbi:cytosine permease [Sporolactobacillus laevolacticus]|uniref:Cytochrome C oxidase subunit III n=1 Tax=Sporolactobacillus laevolacticus DSM 442 TaxID=1395513 RepID=V6IUB7_9BACL|nr:cytosine permease [Sporolactobacillus laevolacticus]EST10525.1 cytochrome C oxidase subunit III [Sporolactobacillus laevolacticus DSM 442]
MSYNLSREKTITTTEPETDLAKEYGATEKVPHSQARNMSFMDMLATWIGANANNGTWYMGGVVAGCAFGGAIAVTLIANPIAYLIMAMVGYMGYKAGTSTMALTRPSFGVRGSSLPTLVNLTSFIGWTAVNTFIAAISISFLLKDSVGWAAFGEKGSAKSMIVGILIMSILHLASISLGHRSVKLIERIGMILVGILGIWETIVVLQNVSFSQIIHWHPSASLSLPFGTAMDTMAAFSLAWIPAIAEFTRYTKNKSSATVAPMIGANVGLFWFAFVGIIATIAAAITTGTYDPNNSDPSTIASKLGLGWLALVVIVLTSTTANAINLMAAGISLTNLTKKIKAMPALWTVTVFAVLLTFVPLLFGSFLDSFIAFLDYIGMVLGPLIGIMITDFFFIKKRDYDVPAFEEVNGKYWFTGGFHWPAIVSWAFGVAAFLLLHTMEFFKASIGATYPVLILSGLVYWILVKIRK